MSGGSRVALIVGLVGLGGWAVLALIDAQPALQGWLIGFVFVSSLSLGALAAVLIHRLTGGGWGEAFAPEAPALETAARATPVLCLFVLPVLVGLPLIYRWAEAPGALRPGVGGYLNIPFFVVRSVIAVGGWSTIAVLLPRIEGPRGRLWAGLGLAFHGIAVSVVAIDWVLSVLPSWTSSNFGMDLAVQQLACGFALAGLQARRRVDAVTAGDLCGLMFATVIGLTYLEFMSYMVVWYGDKPNLDAWYLARDAWPWRGFMWLSLASGIACVGLLAARRRLGLPRAASMVGGCLLGGVLTYQLWLLAPAFGAASLLPAMLALVGQGGLWLALGGRRLRPSARQEALAHAR